MKLYAAKDLGRLLEKHIKDHYKRSTIAANMWKVSDSTVSLWIAGKRRIPLLVLEEMGLEAEVVYKKVKVRK